MVYISRFESISVSLDGLEPLETRPVLQREFGPLIIVFLKPTAHIWKDLVL
jgi:hypothetical protein